MDVAGTLLVALVMVVGLAGVLVPVLPGLALVWAAGLAWVLLDGGGPARWTVLAVMTVFLVAATLLKYAVPGRWARASGAPWSTVGWMALGMVVGFFVIPVVGLFVGAVVGAYLAEAVRLRDRKAAWPSAVAVLKGVGIAVAIELAAGLAMVLTWLLGVWAT